MGVGRLAFGCKQAAEINNLTRQSKIDSRLEGPILDGSGWMSWCPVRDQGYDVVSIVVLYGVAWYCMVDYCVVFIV